MPKNNDDVLGVTYASLDDAARAIKSQADKLNQDLADIKKLVDTAAHNWHGEAQQAYAQKQQEWNRTADSVHISLTQIAQAVSDAGPTYQAGDRRAAAHFQ
ncbi:WXG100 family type VII secretion target [Streptomyces sp. NPDC006711]|uniref:WXG100 family type VII secretion target n=1 Tax=unclassified Streptomyces TaxID=2593676 RepID=UPI0033E22B35